MQKAKRKESLEMLLDSYFEEFERQIIERNKGKNRKRCEIECKKNSTPILQEAEAASLCTSTCTRQENQAIINTLREALKVIKAIKTLTTTEYEIRDLEKTQQDVTAIIELLSNTAFPPQRPKKQRA